MLDVAVFDDPVAGRKALLAEYVSQYNSAKDIIDGARDIKDTDRISANRAAQSALDAIAKVAGVADVRNSEGVRYTIVGLPTPETPEPPAPEIAP